MNNIFKNFFKKNNTLIGVDLGISRVKMVLFEGSNFQNLKIVGFAEESMPYDLINYFNTSSNENTIDPEKIENYAKIVKHCWGKLGTNIKDVAFCLPSSAVISKNIILPRYDNSDDLDLQVKNEVENAMPFNIDDVNIDYSILGPSDQSPTEDNVLLVAAKKEKIDEKMAVLLAAGLNPILLDSENFVIKNGLNFLDQGSGAFTDRVVLMFDVGFFNTKVFVYKNYNLIFTRDFPIGGNTLTQSIVDKYGLDFAQAETMKIQNKLHEVSEVSDVNYEQDILTPFLTNFSMEAVRAVDFFLSSNPAETIDFVLLSGGSTGLPEFEKTIKKSMFNVTLPKFDKEETSLDTRTFNINQFSKIQKGDKINLNNLNNQEGSLYVAAGLALRKVFI